MSDFVPTRDQVQAWMQAGQAAFQRALAADSLASARRLQAAYKRGLEQLDRELRALSVMADADRIRAMREATQAALDGLTRAIESEARRLQRDGAQIGANYAEFAANVGVSFNQPSAAQVERLIQYVDSPAFRQMIDGFAAEHARGVADIILDYASRGYDPAYVARVARRYLDKMPFYDAFKMTRTVQLWSARAGTQAAWLENPDIVLGWIWSSALSLTTCGGCWAMHGTRHDVGEVLNDHHAGKCAPIPITPTWAALGFRDGGELALVPRGEDVFRELDAADQRTVLGPAKWGAWKDGAVQFDQLSSVYQNPLYGAMRREAALEDLIGAPGVEYYLQVTGQPGNGG